MVSSVTSQNPPAYVVGDVHGHRRELTAALQAVGLIDDAANWSAGESRVWFVGDFFDRGPDGTGVVEDVMRLARQAREVGGEVEALLGNHEVLALAVQRFGDREMTTRTGSRSFAGSWLVNGGVAADQESLTPGQVAWLAERPALARLGEYLLMHSDTKEYLAWGASVDAVNGSVGAVLAGDDMAAWWDCWRRLTTRYAFRGERGATAATEVLSAFGGTSIVHGHTLIADQLGIDPESVAEPLRYAGGRVLNVDGGLFAGGPCLVVKLPEER
jgi:hypothetical protein